MDDPDGANLTNIISTWLFSPVPALESFKYESYQPVLPETIFHAFDSLKTVELKLAVRRLPTNLFSSVSGSLRTLSITNPHMFHFRPELLQELQQLRNLSLKLSQSSGDKPDKQRKGNHVFTSMPQLEELRLTRANSHVDANMFKGSYRLRFIRLNKNPQLSELPSELFLDQGNLRLLDLSCNSLSKLPVDLFNSLSQLRLLDLSSNRLTSLSRWVPHLKRTQINGLLSHRFNSNNKSQFSKFSLIFITYQILLVAYQWRLFRLQLLAIK